MDRIATLRAWLADKPGDRFATYSLALELEKSGDLPEAEATMRALVATHPASGAGHFRLGQLLVASGRLEAGQVAWRAGLVALKDCTDPEARRSFGEITRALEATRDEDEV